jgi:enamine deaminase RidA (YjgF/YER057c/UK114 family)
MKQRSHVFSTIIGLPTVLFLLLVALCMQGTFMLAIANAEESAVDPEQRLKELGIELRTPPKPVATYVQAVRTGNLVFLAGHGPRKPEGGYVVGRVGRDLDLQQAQEAARLTAIDLLCSLKAEIGDLNKVKRVVKVMGMVNSVEWFTEHPKVVNGCSNLLVDVFGDRGRHARCAVGMGSLPFNIPIEIDMIVEVEPD